MKKIIFLGIIFSCILIVLIINKKKFADKIIQAKSEKVTSMITLPSGLRYETLKHGNGETTPKPGQIVTVHYTGWLE